MFKKGLVTLVCLTVMSALWAWATTTYSISTKITSLGTTLKAGTTNVYEPIIGGDIRVRGGVAQTTGIKYSNFTTQAAIDVVVTPKAGYKITALSGTGAGVFDLPAVGANQTVPLTVTVKKPAANTVGTAAYVVATFAPAGTTATVTKNWQLQVQNNTLNGGNIKIERATNTAIIHTGIKPLLKSYVDTTPVKVTVTAASGYAIDYLIIDGVKTFAFKNTASKVIDVDPSTGSRLKSVVVGFLKKSLKVTTQTETYQTPVIDVVFGKYTTSLVTRPKPNGIEPVNPVADATGSVRLIVTPTGANNKITSFAVTSGSYLKITYYDAYGTVLPALPATGPVKVTISGITSDITVDADFGLDARETPRYTNCTQTCHLDAGLGDVKATLVAADAQWLASAHSTGNVDCITCHYDEETDSAMPGLDLSTPAAEAKLCGTCHTAAKDPASAHSTASGHTDGICQRCHATAGAIFGAEVGFTGGYAAIMKPYSSSIYRTDRPASASGINCAACHVPHSGGLRQVKTYNGTAVVAWDPNKNAINDQYDVCTSCHTLTDNAGAATDMYHEKSSMDAARMLADSHFDNPATGTVANVGTTVEGYVIRTTSANPCADCHNLHNSDLKVQEEWAHSAHGGHIAKAKADAVCEPALAWFNATYDPDAASCTESRTVKIAPSTRDTTGTVSQLYGKTAAGIAALKAAGATDATGVGWTHYDWDKTLKADGIALDRGDCQRCHTSTGVANFLNAKKAGTVYDPKNNNFSHLSGWTATTGSPQQELLYCWGCHSDSSSGALRNPGALTLDYSTSANDTVAYANVDKSNVCVACHSGNGGSGDSIANSTADFTNLSAIQPHYLAAAGVLMTDSQNGGTGYEFAGVTYTKNGAHQKIGTANFSNTGTEGPCVACHMSGAEKHTFEVSTASAVCANCHNGLTPEVLTAAETRYAAALVALDEALKAKRIFFVASYPYFVEDSGFGGGTAGNGIIEAGEIHRDNGTKNWENKVAGGNGKDTMGAAFNYNLLVHEPGAFAHNKAYAYELIKSSIDYLADGKVDGAGVPAAVIAASEVDPLTHASTAEAAPTSTKCASCHASTSHYGGLPFNKAQYVSDASKPVTCVDCHGEPVSTSAYESIQVQYAGSAHADPNGEAWIHLDWRTSNRSTCARCHNGTAFVAKLGNEISTSSVFQPGDVLKPAEVLACAACHADTATGALRDPADAFTFSIATGTATLTVPGASTLCARCHSGRETAASITANASATGILIFPDVHYAPAAGVLYNKGYDYGSNSALGSHDSLGDTGQGPCVTCHMPNKNHSFAAASCVTCHDGNTAPAVDAAALKASFDTALNNLKLALEAKNIYYEPAHPFFYTLEPVKDANGDPVKDAEGNDVMKKVALTDWSKPYGATNWKHTMGAAYNYNLFWTEKGAWAHNNAYAMQLIEDSIDFMNDGVVNGQ